jgi:predicted nucleic acid-binding protein
MLQQEGEEMALRAAMFLKQGRIVDLDADGAIAAANLAHELGLPLADSVIYATARGEGATVWTQDKDFESLEGVRFVPPRTG